MRLRRRLVGEVVVHGRIGDKDFIDVEAVVAGVLVLGLHHPDDFVRDVVEIDVFADGVAPAQTTASSPPCRERRRDGLRRDRSSCRSALRHINTMRMSAKAGHKPSDCLRAGVVVAVDANVVLARAPGRIHWQSGECLAELGDIGVVEFNAPSGAGSSGLQTGAPGEDDHQVSAEILRRLWPVRRAGPRRRPPSARWRSRPTRCQTWSAPCAVCAPKASEKHRG